MQYNYPRARKRIKSSPPQTMDASMVKINFETNFNKVTKCSYIHIDVEFRRGDLEKDRNEYHRQNFENGKGFLIQLNVVHRLCKVSIILYV